jgi:GxxExxY protein
VAGDVDEFYVVEVGEAEVDGNAAALFFFQAIGVDAGQGADQRRLAVIDVSCGAYYDVLHERIVGRLGLNHHRPLMNVNEHELIERVVGAAYEVSNALGCGFLEKVYERAMAKELGLRGLRVKTQVGYSVIYKEELVGEYFADLVVEDRLVVELKCVEQFSNGHLAQCLNYLKASGLPFGLLVNFQHPKVTWRRIHVHSRSLTANV